MSAPFLRFARDKRGYEHFYLIQPANRRSKVPRLLYWFRTPPNVKIGRQPFDPELRLALETQNPDIAFDWAAIADTPIPPVVEVEKWRERRRVERANRQPSPVSSAEIAQMRSADPVDDAGETVASQPDVVPPPALSTDLNSGDREPGVAASPESPASLEDRSTHDPSVAPTRARRRRRRGRRAPRPTQAGLGELGPEPAPGSEPGPEVRESVAGTDDPEESGS